MYQTFGNELSLVDEPIHPAVRALLLESNGFAAAFHPRRRNRQILDKASGAETLYRAEDFLTQGGSRTGFSIGPLGLYSNPVSNVDRVYFDLSDSAITFGTDFSIIVSFTYYDATANQHILSIDDGTSNNRMVLSTATVTANALRAYLIRLGSTQFDFDNVGSVALGKRCSIGVTWKASHAQMALDGVAETEDTSVTTTTALTTVNIGRGYAHSGLSITTNFHDLIVLPRWMTAAELTAATQIFRLP